MRNALRFIGVVAWAIWITIGIKWLVENELAPLVEAWDCEQRGGAYWTEARLCVAVWRGR